MRKRPSESAPEKRVVLAGMLWNLNTMCKKHPNFLEQSTDDMGRRTYGKDIGEGIREGFEPTEESAVVDDDDDNPFIIGDGGEESPDETEETRQWQQDHEPEVQLKPKYGLDGEAFENVWEGGEPSKSATENP
jgi:hypothetical protein